MAQKRRSEGSNPTSLESAVQHGTTTNVSREPKRRQNTRLNPDLPQSTTLDSVFQRDDPLRSVSPQNSVIPSSQEITSNEDNDISECFASDECIDINLKRSIDAWRATINDLGLSESFVEAKDDIDWRNIFSDTSTTATSKKEQMTDQTDSVPEETNMLPDETFDIDDVVKRLTTSMTEEHSTIGEPQALLIPPSHLGSTNSSSSYNVSKSIFANENFMFKSPQDFDMSEVKLKMDKFMEANEKMTGEYETIRAEGMAFKEEVRQFMDDEKKFRNDVQQFMTAMAFAIEDLRKHW